jgi:bifunctional UDP-N-acetylglucosamine pyrophosphorylase / glucosamine-1-phosphate N-acetyltransferase
MDSTAILLAAGEGKRMKSKIPKVLHRLWGKTLLEHVLTAAEAVSRRQVIVVGHGKEQVMEETGRKYSYVFQEEQLGTGHAVKMAREYLDAREVFILCGDTPLIDGDTLLSLLRTHREAGALATVLTAELPSPEGYGRIIRGGDGSVLRIVEDRDASAAEKSISEINTGTYCFHGPSLMRVLDHLSTDNAQGEYYLTDVLETLAGEGKTAACRLPDFRRAQGVNSREDLAAAGGVMREFINGKLMQSGVSLMDPATAYVDAGVKIGADTIIYPNTIIEGDSIIGRGCSLGPNSHLRNVVLGDEVTVHASIMVDSSREAGSVIGPFQHIRPDEEARD